MKLLTRDISSFRFMTLGGLLSKKIIPSIKCSTLNAFDVNNYKSKRKMFGYSEKNVENYLIDLLKTLGWDSVKKDHDILAVKGAEKLLIECKSKSNKYLYLDEHKGGTTGETVVQQIHRNLERHSLKWGLISDGCDFRLHYNDDKDPSVREAYIEINLSDIVDSGHKWPEEAHILFDILSPNSKIREIDPKKLNALKNSDVNAIVRVMKNNPKLVRFILRALGVAALEDMGVRPMHHRIRSIKDAKTPEEFDEIFESIKSNDSDFHLETNASTKKVCGDINKLFSELKHIDFAHVDHEFFGIVYQKFINNGNASHYTNTSLSKEMAEYIAGRSNKLQKRFKGEALQDNELIIDPAVGSGQLLRGLLPFHAVFFHGETCGIDGWRKLAEHFAARDIDEDALWVAKLNLWLATAKKGAPLLHLKNFKVLDVIKASVNRKAIEINEALGVKSKYKIVGCVLNPPWDSFKKYKGKNQNVSQKDIDNVKRSLNLKVHPLNRAQIFMKIILMMTEVNKHLRYAVILPDSFYVDQNQSLRDLAKPSIEFYFSYPRNHDPITEKKIFGDIDKTRKFGIVFGRGGQSFSSLHCYPLGKNSRIVVSKDIQSIGKFHVFPLFSSPVQAKLVKKWKSAVTRSPKWHDGEFNQGNWNNKHRQEAPSGQFSVVKGDIFTDKDSAFSKPPQTTPTWKKLSKISDLDRQKRKQSRVIFSDYINNSKKLNSASYLPGSKGLLLVDTVLYSKECKPEDWVIYDSLLFSSFVEIYGSSQHMNSWRMNALGLPKELNIGSGDRKHKWLLGNLKLVSTLKLTKKESLELYDIYSHWMRLVISRNSWATLLSGKPASISKIKSLLGKLEKAEKLLALKAKKKSA